ncbi:hypothetical protein [Mycobacterium marinum]|uniref:hypothetical protein n=1 Tax=Mycobacterium marinum TaxID=1781 RepID=UPI00356A1AE6
MTVPRGPGKELTPPVAINGPTGQSAPDVALRSVPLTSRVVADWVISLGARA